MATTTVTSVTKLARCHFKKAGEMYSQASLDSADRKGDWYVWEFECPVPGCEVPDDYNPEVRHRFKMAEGYSTQEFLGDVEALCADFSLQTVHSALITGLDLELRAKAPPKKKSTRGLTDNDKAAWILANKPDVAQGLIGRPIAEWAKEYNRINQD